MAAKKFYAVKKGTAPGIYTDWETCKACVDGFPGAEYKGFATRKEAELYLGIETDTLRETDIAPNVRTGETPEHITVYVDGSYHDGIQKYAFGCVFLLAEDEIRLAFGNGDNPQSLAQRNVTGEMLGAMYAVRTAMKNGCKGITLCYDYEGIEKWVTGEWKSKNERTQKYACSMREWGREIEISFQKVPAHSNVRYNELADETAKRGLTEGNGVPAIALFGELERYREVTA